MFHSESNSCARNIAYFLLFLFAILQITFLTAAYPLCSSDYTYMHICGTDNRVETLHDVFISQVYHYLNINGRFVAHAGLQAFLILGKPIFNATLPFIYALCVFLIIHLSKTRFRSSCAFVALSFWMGVSYPGATIFWECGAFNYIIPTCLSLVFLACFLSERKAFHILSVPMAFLVGNSHEGISFGIFIALLLYAFLNRKNKFSPILYVALFCLLLGFLSNFLSPGTQGRIATEADASSPGYILSRLFALFETFYWYIRNLIFCDFDVWLTTFLLIISAALTYLSFRQNKTLAVLPFALWVGALANFVLALASHTFYPRIFYGANLLALISSYLVVLPYLEKNRVSALIPHITIVLLSIASFFTAFSQIRAMQDREAYIIKQIQEQKSIVFLPEEIADVTGRFTEDWGNTNNYIKNTGDTGARSTYYGGPRDCSVFSDPKEQQIIESLDFSQFAEKRILRVAPDAVVVHLKRRHLREHASCMATKKPGKLSKLLGKETTEDTPRIKQNISCAAFERDGEYYILIVSPEPEIDLDIFYWNGEQETLKITSE